MKYLNYKTILELICIVITSLYLTLLINETAITTLTQFVFVFLYFLLIIILIRQALRKKSKNNKNLTLMITIIIFVLFGLKIPRLYLNNILTITALNDKNSQSSGYECWINEILIEGINDIDDYITYINWDQTNKVYFYNSLENNNYFNIFIPKGRKAEIIIGRHDWSGKIEVEINQKKAVYDLYSNENKNLIIDVDKNEKIVSSEIYYLMVFISIVSTYEIILMLCSIVELVINKKWRKYS